MANKMTYAKSKTKCENILRNKVKCENISLRIPYVIFPQRTGIFKFAKKVSNTFGLPIPFNKNNYFPYCNSSELSDLICFLLDDSLTKGTNRNKVVNCWNSSNVTIEGLVSAYGKELNPIWISSQIGVRVLWFLSKLKFIPFCEEQIIPFIEISSHK